MRPRYESLSYDVVVVGGGLSGICAAIAAARHGARAALIHARPMPGGNSSSEMRMHICGAACHLGKEDVSETGILMELLLANKARNPYQEFSIWDQVLWEKLRFQKNLTLFLNTTTTGVQTEGSRIQSISAYQMTTEITRTFSAKIFVDATGHGTLGFQSGAEYRVGSEGRAEYGEPDAPGQPNHCTMGNTLLFQAADRGVPVPFDKPFWARGFSEEDLLHRGHGDMLMTYGENGITESYNNDSGYWWVEIGGTSDDIIADSEKIREELHSAVYGIWDHMKNGGGHGTENYDLTWVGAVPGTRESRRLVGDYLLNENDILEKRHFDDAVAYGGWPMDEHPPLGLYHKGRPSRFINFPGVYAIPYRSYYSRNIENLMMAGRDISVTKIALGSTRVMATCAVGGQAVGTAAAIAVRDGCTPRDVAARMGELQQTLLRDDCYIPGIENRDALDIAKEATVTAGSCVPGREAHNVINGVARRVGGRENVWESQPLTPAGEWLELRWGREISVGQVRLTFDPNLTREIMPSITRTVKDRQVKGMPEELVKRFSLRFMRQGEVVYETAEDNNLRRLWVSDIPPISCDCININIQETYGYPSARVFEVRVYE